MTQKPPPQRVFPDGQRNRTSGLGKPSKRQSMTIIDQLQQQKRWERTVLSEFVDAVS